MMRRLPIARAHAAPPRTSTRSRARWLAACLAAASVFAAPSPGALAATAVLQPYAGASEAPAAPWRVTGLPGQTKPYTHFSVVDFEGRRALRVEAEKSYGNLVHPLEPTEARGHLAWQWRIEQALPGADLRTRSGDDTPLKVCVLFDEPLDAVPFAERQLLRLARSRSREPIPVATVCYVWDAALPAETVLESPFTGRLRYIVVRSGPSGLGRWIEERRDIAADFRRAFGAESPDTPPMVGVGIGADTDNTQGHSVAYVAAVALQP